MVRHSLLSTHAPWSWTDPGLVRVQKRSNGADTQQQLVLWDKWWVGRRFRWPQQREIGRRRTGLWMVEWLTISCPKSMPEGWMQALMDRLYSKRHIEPGFTVNNWRSKAKSYLPLDKDFRLRTQSHLECQAQDLDHKRRSRWLAVVIVYCIWVIVGPDLSWTYVVLAIYCKVLSE